MSIFDVTADEAANWREQSMTKLFREWIDEQIDMGKNAVVNLVSTGNDAQARAGAGHVAALIQVRSLIETFGTTATLDDAPFVDPAARDRKGKAR